MSTLSHTIRKFNRFELKYLLTLQQAEQFRLALIAGARRPQGED